MSGPVIDVGQEPEGGWPSRSLVPGDMLTYRMAGNVPGGPSFFVREVMADGTISVTSVADPSREGTIGAGLYPTQFLKYRSMPVQVAEQLAATYSRALVIVLSWDDLHRQFNTVTYAKDPAFKQRAFELGEQATKAIGGELELTTFFEDFRDPAKIPGGKSPNQWLWENILALAERAEGFGNHVTANALRALESEVWL